MDNELISSAMSELIGDAKRSVINFKCHFRYKSRGNDQFAMVKIANELKVPPGSVARLILNEKYSKNEVKSMWKNPDLIPDPMLSANVL